MIMNSELKKILYEEVAAKFKEISQQFPGGTDKQHLKGVGIVKAEIRTQNLLNKRRKLY
jgi:hypothetical protein